MLFSPRKSLAQVPIRFVYVVVLALFSVASAQAVDREVVLAYLSQLQADTGAPGVSAAVAVKGEIVFSGGVGLSDVQAGSAQTGRSVHNIGSISKTQAVVAVMQLVERGKVSLDAELQTYVPWFPRKEYPITIRQVLTHTSGIGHYEDLSVDKSPPELRFKHYTVFEESTRPWRDQPLVFKPMQYWYYSSFATNLLQAVVETASGVSFEEYLRLNVWAPAGMLVTQFDVPSRIVPGRGRGYERNKKTGQLENDPDEDVSYKYAGGGVISTDEDLCRFGHALNSGRLLKPASLAEMYRLQLPAGITNPPKVVERFKQIFPTRAVPDSARNQALIWRVERDAQGRRMAQHGGSVKGTNSHLRNFVDDDIVVALHFNHNDGGKDVSEASEALAQLFLPSRSLEKK